MTTQADLDQLARIINNLRETPPPHPDQVFVQFAYGQPRLFKAGGAIEVSPRLPKRDLEAWMRAYYSGYSDALEASRAATRAQED